MRLLFGLILGLAAAELFLRWESPGQPVAGTVHDTGGGWVEYRIGKETVLRARRVPDRPRIVFMGASTVVGVPFSERMSPPAWLQLILDHWQVDAEVLKLAHRASSSSEVKRWMDFVLELEPTVVVVLSGHNEYLDARSLLDDHWWHRSKLAERAVWSLGLEPDVPRKPAVDHEFPHADVAAVYAANLKAMQSACTEAGVELLLCVPPSNLAQCPPVLGSHASAAWTRAVEHLRRDEFAAAHAEFLAARDRDAWPHRATSEFGESVRAQAATFVDLERTFSDASATGTPGWDLFVDHCHPTVKGQRLMAVTVAEAIRDAGWLTFPDPLPEPPTAQDGVAAFGFTEHDRRKASRDALRMLVHLVIAGEQPGPLATMVRQRLELAPWRPRDMVSLAILAAIEGDAGRVLAEVESMSDRQLESLQAYYDHNPRVVDAFRRCGFALLAGALVQPE